MVVELVLGQSRGFGCPRGSSKMRGHLLSCVTRFSPRSSGNRRLRAAPDLLGDKLRSEVLRPAGRGLTLQNRPNPLASSLIKGHKAGVVGEAGTPGKYRSAALIFLRYQYYFCFLEGVH